MTALLRAVAQSGAPTPSTEQSIAVCFAGDGAIDPTSVSRIESGWMLRTVLRLRKDAALAHVAGGLMVGAATAEPFVVVARDRDGSARVRAAALGRELLLEISSTPDSLLSAATVQAALVARHGSVERPEEEPVRIPSSDLTAWMASKPGGPPGQDAWRNAESTDARWCWATVLLLLAVEQRVRRRAAGAVTMEVNRAAA